ncbi:MAG: EFR1 family ferrodoxin [Bacteroides sp.]|nr:EFR1 family ferrodoxin [Bacteroides sp.]
MIFYFSATGNSLQVATAIAQGQQEELISVPECFKKGTFEFTLREDEKIGFVFPVYFYGLPTIITQFIGRLKLNNYYLQYIFAVCTCGGSSGYVLYRLRTEIARKHLWFNYGNTILLPDNYILLFNLLPPPEKRKKMFAAAIPQINKVNEEITSRRQGISKENQGALLGIMTSLFYPMYSRGRKTAPFHATKACTGCGLCGRICPSEAIRLEKERPIWVKDKCVQCLGCIHRCPVRAIEYGTKTRKRERYVNPNCKSLQ